MTVFSFYYRVLHHIDSSSIAVRSLWHHFFEPWKYIPSECKRQSKQWTWTIQQKLDSWVNSKCWDEIVPIAAIEIIESTEIYINYSNQKRPFQCHNGCKSTGYNEFRNKLFVLHIFRLQIRTKSKFQLNKSKNNANQWFNLWFFPFHRRIW